MDGPKRGAGLRAPLFNRLFDLEPRQRAERQPDRVLSRHLVLESVRTELVRLLNTRCPHTFDDLRARPRSVVNYGLPDFLTLKPSEDGDRQRLAAAITEAIAAFEPRLRDPAVRIALDPRLPDLYTVSISAMLVLDNLSEPVSFPFTIDQRSGVTVVSGTPRAPELAV